MPCRQRPLEQYSHISSTRSYSPPPHRPVVLPSVHGILPHGVSIPPRRCVRLSAVDAPTQLGRRTERSDLQLGLLGHTLSIYLSHTGRTINKQQHQQQQHVLSRHLGTPRPLPIVPSLAGPLSRDDMSGTVPCARLGGLLFGMGRGGYKRIYLVWWAGGKGVADVKACERSGGTVPCGMASRPESGRAWRSPGAGVLGGGCLSGSGGFFRAVRYCGGCFEQDRGVLLSKPGSFVGVVTWVVCRSSGGSWRGCSS